MLGDLGQLGRRRTTHGGRHVLQRIADLGLDLVLGERHQHAALAGHALFHDQGLVPARRLVVAQGAAVAAQPAQPFQLGLNLVAASGAHASTSFRAMASSAMLASL